MLEYRNIPFDTDCYSSVANPGDRILCVTPDDMVMCNAISNKDYIIKRGCPKQRKGEVFCYPYHKESRSIYLHYDGLKAAHRNLIKAVLCGGIEPELFVLNRESQERERRLQEIYNALPNMVEVSQNDIDELTACGLLTPEEVARTARAAGWCRLWRKLDVKTARKMGFKSVTELQEALFKRCLNEQESKNKLVRFPKPVNSIRVLDRKAREFAKTGITVLLGSYFGNANRRDIDTKIHAVLMDLAASPLKYSFEDISMMYNRLAASNGMKALTTSTIKQHLNQPQYKRVWFSIRHGKKAADEYYQQQIWKDRPSRPDALWSIDGTTMQLYYKDKDNKLASDLYVYFVTDGNTGAVIGKSISYAETTNAVWDALQDAVATHGYLPYQIQYDNSSANISDAMKSLYKNIAIVDFPSKPESGRSKYVEGYIGHFQQRVLRYMANFKGGNITSPGLNGKANPELLKWLKNNMEEVPTFEEVTTQFFAAVEEWNNRGVERDNYGEWVGESKIQRYLTYYEGRRKADYFDQFRLFMVELARPYKYGAKGIEMTIDKVKHCFIVPDSKDSLGDFMFAQENRGREFKVRVNRANASRILLLDKKTGKQVAEAFEKERFAAAIMDYKEGQGAKIKEFNKKQEEYGYNYALRTLQEQQQVLEQYGLKATGTGDFFGSYTHPVKGETFGWWDREKNSNNAIESKKQDVLNGVSSEPLTDFERAMMGLIK